MLHKRIIFLLTLPLLLTSICIFSFTTLGTLEGDAHVSTTHTVCASGCDFMSIQAAIDAAGSGDTISLAGEIFTEPFTVDKSLTIEGDGAENTILQAAESQALSTSRVITVTEGVTATITGVTIRYGTESGSFPRGYGGGIFSQGTLTISYSTVFSNTAGAGGGIYSNAALVIIHCIVDSNTSEYSGGGIYNGDFNVSDAPQLTLLYSIISNNKAYSASEGGGGLRNSDNIATISNTSFLNNYAYTGGGGL